MSTPGKNPAQGIPISSYQIRLCENPSCGLRYPCLAEHPFGERCPACNAATRIILERPLIPESMAAPNPRQSTSRRFEALLDNIRSAWNVGAIFRTAECLGVQKLYLCGITPTPQNDTVSKTSLGAEKLVEWIKTPNAVPLALQLKAQGFQLWALEQEQRSQPIHHISPSQIEPSQPIVLIVGNEVTGVDPELLDLSDKIIHIPMRGKKRSLNVEVAFGIAAWAFLR